MPSLDFDLEESQFRTHYAQQLPALEEACAALTAMVAAVVTRTAGVDIAKVEGRVKEADECIRKFVRKYRPALEENNTPYEIQHYITDLVGVRVVCLYEDELEKIAAIVRGHFAVIDVTDKVTAVESTEASFGYKGLHLDLKLSHAERTQPEHAAYAHLPFELQVRTIIQDSWSVLDHKIKYKKSIPQQLKRRINVLSALFELADREFLQIRDATAAELLQAPDETADPALDAVDTLLAALPAGTLSGAPKVRAMEIIDELEIEKRGVGYAGAVGYFGADGSVDTCIVLRTALFKDGQMYIQAGGGVVADSDPDAEYDETLHKARALRRAAEESWRFI